VAAQTPHDEPENGESVTDAPADSSARAAPRLSLKEAVRAELEDGTRLDEGGAPQLAALEAQVGRPVGAEEALEAFSAVKAELAAGVPREPVAPVRLVRRESHVPVSPRAGQQVWTGNWEYNEQKVPVRMIMRPFKQFPTALYKPDAPAVTVRNELEFEREWSRGWRPFDDYPPEVRRELYEAAQAQG
jgi:hypothetical protein